MLRPVRAPIVDVHLLENHGVLHQELGELDLDAVRLLGIELQRHLPQTRLQAAEHAVVGQDRGELRDLADGTTRGSGHGCEPVESVHGLGEGASGRIIGVGLVVVAVPLRHVQVEPELGHGRAGAEQPRHCQRGAAARVCYAPAMWASQDQGLS